MSVPFRLVAAGQALCERLPSAAESDRMSGIVSVMEGADLAFCNLEVALRTAAPSFPAKESVVHAGPVEVLDVLRRLGITALSVANNHFGDLGPHSVLEAIREIESRGFLFAGAGGTAADAAEGQQRDGVALSAVLAGAGPLPGRALDAQGGLPARPGVNGLPVFRTLDVDPEGFAALQSILKAAGHTGRVEREIRSGRKRASADSTLDFYGTTVRSALRTAESASAEPIARELFVDRIAKAATSGVRSLVSIHYHDWEPDWTRPPDWLRELAHMCVDAGAFAVLGHGPPVMAGIEVYRSGLIAYGLGNLVFHTHRVQGYAQPEVWESGLLDAVFDRDFALESLRVHPVRLDRSPGGEPGFPRLAGASEAVRINERLNELGSAFGTTVDRVAGTTADLAW